MSGKWNSSDRRSRLPNDWQQLRQHVITRANGQCEATIQTDPPKTITPETIRCPNHGTDVDHINRGDNHAVSNLQLLCGPCHAIKTGDEATEALRQLNAKLAHPATRATHPGLR